MGSSLSLAFILIPAVLSPGVAQIKTLCFGETPTIVGTPNGDRLVGTRARDVILGLDGDDTIIGRHGDDILCGDAGDDRVYGGAGNDILQGDTSTFGEDLLVGGRGNDRLYGQLGDDELEGGTGDDELYGGDSDEEDLSPGEDELEGGGGNDRLSGGPGPDEIDGGRGSDAAFGGSGDDEVHGGSGDDELAGDAGNDELFGGRGADRLLGGDGDDGLFGGPGDDVMDGGPGNDTFDGGRGNDQQIDEIERTLAELVDLRDRAGIRQWALPRSIAALNAEVAGLDAARRDGLAEVVLNSNATGTERDRFVRIMQGVLDHPDLGFYAEIWSYTFIELVPGGFFGGCGHVFLDPGAYVGLSDVDARNVLMHESFHSFNCVNGGPVGSLDEGSAIWIFKLAFPESLLPGESWAEATYGTKLFYRDFQGNPDFPLIASVAPTSKLLEVFEWLGGGDPSALPWNSTDRLVTCFDRYFVQLKRNVDFFTVWLPAVEEATRTMLADPECRPA